MANEKIGKCREKILLFFATALLPYFFALCFRSVPQITEHLKETFSQMTHLWPCFYMQVNKRFSLANDLDFAKRLFKLCTFNISLVMEVFWQIQNCEDICHNSSLNIPRIALKPNLLFWI